MKYFFGEFGLEAIDSFDTLSDAERAAITASKFNDTFIAYSVWNKFDDVESIALNGELYTKQQD